MLNEEEERLELISRYLLGRLSVAEEKEFQRRMKDPSFQQELALQKEIAEAVVQSEDSRLKAMLEAEESAIGEEPKPAGLLGQRPLRLAGLAIAASFLLILAIYWVLNREQSSPGLYASYFQPYKNTLVSVERELGDKTLLQRAFAHYEDKEYQEALSGFASLLSTGPNDDIAFYQANALLSLGRAPEAIPILENIIRNGQSQYVSQAKWYLALAYIQEGLFTSARPLLEELKGSAFYEKRAEELLQEDAFR